MREEENLLLYKLCEDLIETASKWGKSEKILITALGLVKRYYLSKNILELNPQIATKVALLLAAKIEDVSINFKEKWKIFGLSQEIYLKTELRLLEGSKFYLTFINPFETLDFLFERLGPKEVRNLQDIRSSSKIIPETNDPSKTPHKVGVHNHLGINKSSEVTTSHYKNKIQLEMISETASANNASGLIGEMPILSKRMNVDDCDKTTFLKEKCRSNILHFLKTDLYFLINPISLTLAIYFSIVIEEYNCIDLKKFMSFLENQGVYNLDFFKQIMEVLCDPKYSKENFSSEMLNQAILKFKEFQRVARVIKTRKKKNKQLRPFSKGSANRDDLKKIKFN